MATDERNGRPRNRLLLALSSDEQQRLIPFLEEVEFSNRASLCTAGEPIRHAVFPHDCVTSTLAELPEGDAVEVGLMGAEGVVGLDLLFGVTASVSTVIVQVAGRAACMRASDFQREIVARNGETYRLLLRYSRAFLGMVAQSGACNASHALEQRLARWLLMVHDRVERDRFALTHEYVAYMLGVRRASVTQAANALRSAGAIDYERGEIRIIAREQLERVSCGCYTIVRDLMNGLMLPEAPAS